MDIKFDSFTVTMIFISIMAIWFIYIMLSESIKFYKNAEKITVAQFEELSKLHEISKREPLKASLSIFLKGM